MTLNLSDQIILNQTAQNLISAKRNHLKDGNIVFYFWPETQTDGVFLNDGEYHPFYAFEVLDPHDETTIIGTGYVVGEDYDSIYELWFKDQYVDLHKNPQDVAVHVERILQHLP